MGYKPKTVFISALDRRGREVARFTADLREINDIARAFVAAVNTSNRTGLRLNLNTLHGVLGVFVRQMCHRDALNRLNLTFEGHLDKNLRLHAGLSQP